jgi:hypothetical protein
VRAGRYHCDSLVLPWFYYVVLVVQSIYMIDGLMLQRRVMVSYDRQEYWVQHERGKRGCRVRGWDMRRENTKMR